MENKRLVYQLRRSRGARRLRIAVYFDSQVVVTAPHSLNVNAIERFVAEKQAWIIEKLKHFATRPRTVINVTGTYREHRDDALAIVKARVEHWNSIYGFTFNKIAIRNQKRRWGSCSRAGNLNFNYKIKFLPESLVDYLVVHELCHLQEFNHSSQFWTLVSRAIPDFRTLRKEFKKLVV